jgi:poly(3-hydroxybutyrate) depolymerase
MKSALLTILFVLITVSSAAAQARDTIAIMRTRYNTAKNAARAQGELKQKLDAIDQQLARAIRLGRTGELRRLYTQGSAVASGREWTPETEFTSSLVLRTERVFVGPEKPISLRLEQIYAPTLELSNPLTVRITVNRAATGGAGGANAQPAAKLKDGPVFSNVGRDFIDEPLRFDVDLSGLEDGRVTLRAEVQDGTRALGAASLPIEVHRGLDDRLRKLQSSTNPDVLYPVDYIRNVDRGRFPVGQFNFDREVALAEAALASVSGGKDPFTGKTGDFKRHYLFQEAGEIMPYRVYVPTSYKADRAYPLIIALHGNGLTEDYFFTGAQAEMTKLAEERGYIVAAPLGYRVDGGYGRNNGSRSAEEAPKIELSEKDVMHVLDLMKRDYRVDPDRIYVAGHSMGGGGAWFLAPRYPQIWASLATFAGGGDPSTVSGMKHISQFVVHGDADTTASVENSRTMVAELKRQGVEHQYIEVPGGTHGGVVAPNLRAMFDFFDKHKKTPAAR